MRKDVFICHASEDKPAVIRPLVASLEHRGISCWFDENEIFLGQSITQRVNEGLQKSDFVVIVFSLAFMRKHWPMRELWAVLNLEASSGKNIILPVIVGTQNDVFEITREFPLLNDKLFIVWDGDTNRVAFSIEKTIMNERGLETSSNIQMCQCGQCYSHFQRGAHICLGCKGAVVYGLTQHEKLKVRQDTISMIIMLEIIILFFLPYATTSFYTEIFPLYWKSFIWVAFAGIGAAVIAGLYFENKKAKENEHLIRTFMY